MGDELRRLANRVSNGERFGGVRSGGERLEREKRVRERRKREKHVIERPEREKHVIERPEREKHVIERPEREKRVIERLEREIEKDERMEKGIYADKSLYLLEKCNAEVKNIIYGKFPVSNIKYKPEKLIYIAFNYPTLDIKKAIKEAENYIIKKSLYPHNYTKKSHKKVVTAIKSGKTRQEAVDIAGVSLNDLIWWYNHGKKGESPYDSFYEDYTHARKTLKLKKEMRNEGIDGKEVKNIANGRIKTGRKNDEIFKREIEREERERLEKEKLEKEKLEKEKIEKEKLEKEKLEKEKIEKEKIEKEKLEKEKIEKEKIEKEKLERERLEREEKGIYVDKSLDLLGGCSTEVIRVLYDKFDVSDIKQDSEKLNYIALNYPTQDIENEIIRAEDQIKREHMLPYIIGVIIILILLLIFLSML